MKIFAFVRNGFVQAVVHSDEEMPPSVIPMPDGFWVEATDTVGAGDTYDGTTFARPPAPEPDPRLWWLDVGPFKDRLGMDQPAIGASTHSACRGVTEMLVGRKYVDLKDPLVVAMLNVLIANEQPTADPVWPGSGPMTAAKRDAILNTPTTERERHVKGLLQ